MTPRRTRSGPTEVTAPIVEWRYRRLLGAGFDPDAAAALAADRQVDLHAVLGLVDRGCPPELALRILAPLEGPDRWSR
jgi:hypothetical protein